MESHDAERTVAAVVWEQFSAEVASKEKELEHIEDRIALAKMMLKRLRLGILAQHYGMAGFAPLPLDYSEENVGVQPSWEAFEKGVLEDQRSGSEGCEENPHNEPCSCNPSDCKEVASQDDTQSSSCGSSNIKEATQNGSRSSTCDLTDCKKAASQSSRCDPSDCKKASQAVSQSSTYGSSAVEMEYFDYAVELEAGCDAPEHNSQLPLLSKNNVPKTLAPHQPDENSKDPSHTDISRFYSKKRIIVGNTSQYLDPTVRQSGEGSTHKWMVYVRGPSEEPDISHFVRAVRFFLHPSYHPNDIVRITNPPFHLTRLGWGEFPIRVQLEFCDRRNKPSDIIHNLVLDRTHTGLQTLGAEIVVDLDIVSERVHSSLLANGPLSVNRNGVLLMQTTVVNQDSGSHTTMVMQQSVTGDASFTDLQNSLVNIEEQSMEDDVSEEFSDSEMSPKPSLVIHHVSLPCSSPSDSILLDHDYCTCVVVNWTVGPLQQLEDYSCSSAENRTLFLTTGLNKCLHMAARAIPLCGPPTEDFFLTASSLAQFKGWRVGRRRAVEWMRAVAIRRHVQKRLKISSLLTTRQVLMWCRRNGYTPLDPVVPSGSGFCKFCGCQLEVEEEEGKEEWAHEASHLHERCQERWFGTQVGKAAGEEESGEEGEEEEGEEEEEREGEDADTAVMYASVSDLFSTLSPPFQLFSDVVALQEQMEREEKAHFQDQAVDIITVETSEMKKKELATPRLRIPQTPELKWVQQTAAAVGIHIYPAVIDRMYAHVVEHMIFMACSRFLRAILTQAVQESGNIAEGELNRERIIVPLHLYRAIQHLELCDILTNRYLGLPNTH